LLYALLIYEKREKKNAHLTAKTALSGLFVLTAFLQPSSVSAYSNFLITGLIFCLLGDVCLALRAEKMFKAGLVAFLIGHFFYVVGFTYLVDLTSWASFGAIPVWLVSLLVFLWLRPHLKSMLFPVVLYILVIAMMLSGAWGVFAKSSLNFSGRVSILGGAFCFYLSDIFVARDKFKKPEYLNRLIGLPLYYFGQFLLAFSLGLI